MVSAALAGSTGDLEPTRASRRRRVPASQVRRAIVPQALTRSPAPPPTTSDDGGGDERRGEDRCVEARRDRQRRMLADYLKLMSWWLGRPPVPAMPRRWEQTLHGLLRGDSEKQIAAALGVSVHTVHEYVKRLHRRLGVETRSELLARFLPRGGPTTPAAATDNGAAHLIR